MAPKLYKIDYNVIFPASGSMHMTDTTTDAADILAALLNFDVFGLSVANVTITPANDK